MKPHQQVSYKPPKQTFPQNVKARSKIQCHFEVQREIWQQFQQKLAKHGYSASLFFREKISDFLEDEPEPPLACYGEVYCNNCRYVEECKVDTSIQIRCFLAALALSFYARIDEQKRGLLKR
jgi:hypothetical protein